MAAWHLDTNHLGAAVKPVSPIREKIERAYRNGERIGTCLPVICEWQAGIQELKRKESYRQTVRILLRTVRIWPLDVGTTERYGEVFQELRKRGKALSQVDMMVAALARQMGLTVLTSDKDLTGYRPHRRRSAPPRRGEDARQLRPSARTI